MIPPVSAVGTSATYCPPVTVREFSNLAIPRSIRIDPWTELTVEALWEA